MNNFFKNLYETLYDATVDAIVRILVFFTDNLMNIARILNLILPYFMYIIGKALMEKRGDFSIGGEIFIPIAILIIIYYLKSTANKLGKGTTVPVPTKRFTEVSEEGEVSVEHDRLQELLLYTADLEDWLERKGIL